MAKEPSRARDSSKKSIAKEFSKICEDDYESPSDEDLYEYSDSDDYTDDSDSDDGSDIVWRQLCFVDENLLRHLHTFCNITATKKAPQNEAPGTLFNPEVAAKNAQQLVDEEEREKRRVEKRRAKKKRRKEKKKEEKGRLLASKNDNLKTEKQDVPADKKSTKSAKSSPNKPSSSSADDLEDGEEFLDVNSAFVSVAVSKKKKISTNSASTAGMEKTRPPSKKTQVPGDKNIAESERLAVIGYKMASKEEYEQAVEYFSKAIRLVNDDHRFFSNRSFCHCQLGHYSKALKDADKAITLAPNSPKGYYRRGEALKGLTQYKEAEEAFERVVQLDAECEDAVQELEHVKLQQLLEMGFLEKHALAALQQHQSVQGAIDALTGVSFGEPANLERRITGHIVFNGGVEEEITRFPSVHQTHEGLQQAHALIPKANKMDPSNPEGHLSLWVGNVSHEVSEKQLVDIFSKFGVVLSVRLLPEKYCAFINFRDKTSPGPAMKSLQNRELGGEKLLIRYPNNPVPEAHQQIIIKKTAKPVATTSVQAKVTGPVNGDECHFWRTTGCAFGSKCRYKHLKENKGVDKKPWQKTS